MRIELRDIKTDHHIESLLVRSMGMSIYLAELTIDGVEYQVLENGKPLKRRHQQAVIDAFEDFAPQRVYLHHESSYDEMIGQPVRQSSNALRTRLR